MTKQFLLLSLILILSGTASFAQSGIPGACNLHKDKGVSVLDGNGTLGETYNNTKCGLNYVQASALTETRSAAVSPPFNAGGTGLPTVLSLGGIPSGHSILQAYVWYTVSYKTAPSSSSVVINSNVVGAVAAGTHGPKCWNSMGETGSKVYRADVTSVVTGNGSYNIDILGLGDKNWEVDGVTLMVIYKDNSASYQGNLILWDGANTCGTGGCALTQTMTISPPACANSTSGNAFVIVSDMQENINPPHSATLNGVTTGSLTNDFYNFDVAATNVTAGQSTANFAAIAGGSDCFNWSVMGLYYQTTGCVTCTPCAMTISVTPTNATCNSPGAAVASVSGAPAPYTYAWSNGASTSAVSNLSAGLYYVNVTDATGCTASQAVSIISGDPAVSFATSSVKCYAGNDGSATANPSGGNPPYTFSWNTNPIQSTQTATGLIAGNYAVTVTDANGWCSSTNTVSISQPSAIIPGNVVTNASSCSAADGMIISSTSGGTPPYLYSWSNGNTTSANTGLLAGGYSVTITDGKGCSITKVDSVSCLTGKTEINSYPDFTFFPNPTTGFIYVSLPENTVEIFITDVWGRKMNCPLSPIISRSASIDMSAAAPGIYFLQVRSLGGCAVKKIIRE